MRYSYTQVALFALTASALPTNLRRDPQLLGGLLDASYDLADAAGSIASPFVDAGSSIVGGLASGTADVIGGVASGVFGYKEKREAQPQLLGGLLDASYDLADAAGSIASPFVDAGSSIIGGVASGAADVAAGVAEGVLGYKEKREAQLISDVIEAGSELVGDILDVGSYGYDEEEYKKSKRSAQPQILGSLIGAGIDAGKDVAHGVLSIPGDVLSSLYGYESDYDEYKKSKRAPQPQILGSIIGAGIDAGIDAGKDVVGGVLSIPGDVLSSLSDYGSDYDEYKKNKRQILGDLFDDGEDILEEVAEDVTGEFDKRSPQLLGGLASATGDVIHAGGSVASTVVGSGASVVGGLASGVGSIGAGVYDALIGGYEGKDEYKVKRDPQGLVGSLVGGLTNTVDSLLGGDRYDDEDRYEGPEVVVVTPPAGPPVGYEWKA